MNRISKINKRRRLIAANLCIIIAAASMLKENVEDKRKMRRRWWVRPWLNQKKGNISLPDEFIQSDKEKYKNFLRMDEKAFEEVLRKIEHRITKHSLCRQTISAKNKLIITLRYLATGESFRSLMYNYRISESTISLFVPTVCEAIYEEMQHEYLRVGR